jgi:hypothetical protein
MGVKRQALLRIGAVAAGARRGRWARAELAWSGAGTAAAKRAFGEPVADVDGASELAAR